MQEEIVNDVKLTATHLQQEHPGVHVLPSSIICCSALSGQGVTELASAISALLGEETGHDHEPGLFSADDDDGWDADVNVPQALPEMRDALADAESSWAALPECEGAAAPVV
jgi:hypothetical protein